MLRPDRHCFLIISYIFMVMGLASCSTPQGNADDGQRWYMMHNCYGCHGPNGNDGQGPVIDADELSFRKFKSIIRDAGSPIMPKFPEEKLPAQDVADIYAWLKTR